MQAEIKSAVLQVLRTGRAKVEKSWCQGNGAKDADGMAIAVYEEGAVSFCMYGAIVSQKENLGPPMAEALRLLTVTVGAAKNYDMFAWNDAPDRTKEEVLAKYDEAILAAEND